MNSCTFGPGIQDTCSSGAHAASPWSLLGTETPLWAYLCAVAFVLLASVSASRLKNHYEIAGSRPVRRWYGTGAWVCLRAPGCTGEADRIYRVLAWDDGAAVPWLLVTDTDDDAGAFWAPVTDFAPHAVRRLRPHLGRGRLPVLFAHETYPGRVS